MTNKIIRTHFTDKEMDCGCGCEKTVAPELLMQLEALRCMLGKPLSINSGARCEAHNREVGGKPGSWHLKGLAVDIACKGSNLRGEVIRAALPLGFHGIGLAKNFIHLDLRPADKGRCWLYK